MISNFPAKKAYNPGGYKSFQFIPYYQVSGFPAITAMKNLSQVIFYETYDWLNGYATAETLSYDEEYTPDENGGFYDLTITGFIPGDQVDLIDIMDTMPFNRFIVMILDTKGVTRLVGSTSTPLDFTANFNS